MECFYFRILSYEVNSEDTAKVHKSWITTVTGTRATITFSSKTTDIQVLRVTDTAVTVNVTQ